MSCIHLQSAAVQGIWKPLFIRLLSLIDRVWAATRPVISLAPSQTAGKPDHEIARAYDVMGSGGDEEDGEDGALDHTNLLSGCWRATKDAGELLSVLFALPIKQAGDLQSIWTRDDVDQAGIRFLVWMHEIRHRGTFSKIALAFTELVNAVKSVPMLAPLCRQWLERELHVITTDSLSITRRSAALPFAVLALVASDIPLMDLAFETLNDLARCDNPSSSDVTKIHAFNILKIILLDARQAKILDRYFERAVMTALMAFSSPNWNVRNVGLILFSTIVHRTLATGRGSQDFFASRETLASRQTLASWHAKYPKIVPYITDYLIQRSRQGQGATENAHSPLFPILIIVRSLRWSPQGAELASNLLGAVGVYLGSKQWQVRTVAAQAVSSLLSPEQALESAVEWQIDVSSAENSRHGTLLLLLHLVRDVIVWAEVGAEAKHSVEDVLLRLAASTERRVSPLITQSIIDVIAAYVANAHDVAPSISDAVIHLSKLSLRHNTPNVPGYSLLIASATTCLLANDLSVSTLKSLLRTDNEDSQVAALEHLVNTRRPDLTAQLVDPLVRLATGKANSAPRIAAFEALIEIPLDSVELASDHGEKPVQLANNCLDFAVSSRCVPLREAALGCAGWALAWCVTLSDSPSAEEIQLKRLADLLQSASDINQSQPTRWSALAALGPLSSLLFPHSAESLRGLSRVHVVLHDILLRLLQDDDESIRSGAADIVRRGLGVPRAINLPTAMDLEWSYIGSCETWYPRSTEILDFMWSKVLDVSEFGKYRLMCRLTDTGF